MEKLELLLEKLKESIPEAEAKIKLKVKGTNCRVSGEGDIAGMLVALSSLIKQIREQMEDEGIERKEIKFFLESFCDNETEGIDE